MEQNEKTSVLWLRMKSEKQKYILISSFSDKQCVLNYVFRIEYMDMTLHLLICITSICKSDKTVIGNYKILHSTVTNLQWKNIRKQNLNNESFTIHLWDAKVTHWFAAVSK